MARFVLIHGAMHGGWCWERVTPLLHAAGHEVVAPDLPGLGADKTPPGAVTLERWGRFIAALLQAGPGKSILAGHSMGGMAISQAAEFAPAALTALVYVTALLPRNGDTPFKLTRRDSLADAGGRLTLTPTPDGSAITASPEAAGAAFYGETLQAWAARAIARLVPQPLGVMQEAASLSAENFGRVPRVYIECARDRVISLEAQRAMQAASPCTKRYEIDTDHSPFYSRPEELAAILQMIAETN